MTVILQGSQEGSKQLNIQRKIICKKAEIFLQAVTKHNGGKKKPDL